MSLSKTRAPRRALLALGAFAALGMLIASPAAADHGYRGGRYWRPNGPRVGVVVGLPLPPLVVVGGRPAAYYGPYEPRYAPRYERSAYQSGYADGYDDGYDDRGRDEWRRRQRAYHRYHDGCDH